MTPFFFLAGLELKRELVVGSLRRPADAAVPVVAAACGVAVPALIYLAVNANGGHPEGWAVPAATDIAFALAVLAVVGSNLPTALRTFPACCSAGGRSLASPGRLWTRRSGGATRDVAKTAVLAGSLGSALLGVVALSHRDRFHATP